MIRISELRLPLEAEERQLREEAARLLGCRPWEIDELTVLRQAVDARHRGSIRLSYTVAIRMADEETILRSAPSNRVERYEPPVWTLPVPGDRPLATRPVVVGAGPAGLLAAWVLAKAGYRPLVLERGAAMDERRLAVQAFLAGGPLNEDSNVQFGEGGAGTFSDGKLTTRIRDPRCPEILRLLVRCGAPEDILWSARPHVGTDRLWQVLPAVRQEIESLGGEVRFGCRVESLVLAEGRLTGLRLTSGEVVETQTAVLAVGHSARDTLQTLLTQGVIMEAKPFAVGFRAEHPQAFVDRLGWGPAAGHPKLGAADYHLTAQIAGRPVYSFCMCPGGLVVNASSERGRVAVNGMSLHARDGANANAAIVAAVRPEELDGTGPLAGVAFQRTLEEAAFALTGGEGAPAQRLEDFLAGRATKRFGAVQPTVRPQAVPASLNGLLPPAMENALRGAFAAFDRQMPGFVMGDAVLTGVESRTSSPVRLNRGEDLQAEGIAGLYPAGEGAGYAGGILSAAADGMRAAEALLSQWRMEQ